MHDVNYSKQKILCNQRSTADDHDDRRRKKLEVFLLLQLGDQLRCVNCAERGRTLKLLLILLSTAI